MYAASNHSDLSLNVVESLKECDRQNEFKWLFWTNMRRLNEVKNTWLYRGAEQH
jgi:hypothetical protein